MRNRSIAELTRTGGGHPELFEQVEHPPGAYAIAIVTPCIIQDIRLRPARRELGPKPFAEGKVLEIEPEIDCQSLARSANRKPAGP